MIECRKKEIEAVLLDDFVTLDLDQLLQFPSTRRLTAEECRDEFYLEGANVPAGEFSVVTELIKRASDADSHFSQTDTVCLFNLPETMKVEVARFMHNYRFTPAPILQRNIAIAPLRKMITEYLLDRFNVGAEELKLDLMGFNSPNLQTVTIDRKIGQKTGLHLDSWYGNSLKNRLCDRKRVVFNFGPVPRWFLYVPISLNAFYEYLSRSSPELNWTPDTPILRIDEALTQLCPVVRCLKVNPGQGYIAPTESVIHDATTRWADKSTLNLQLLGEFSWHANDSQLATELVA